ncbi:hypothetical protein [Streptomyces mirabilis]
MFAVCRVACLYPGDDPVELIPRVPRAFLTEGVFLRHPSRLACDYERLTATSEAMIKVAMIRLMLVRLAGQPSRWSLKSHRKTVEDLIAA